MTLHSLYGHNVKGGVPRDNTTGLGQSTVSWTTLTNIRLPMILPPSCWFPLCSTKIIGSVRNWKYANKKTTVIEKFNFGPEPVLGVCTGFNANTVFLPKSGTKTDPCQTSPSLKLNLNTVFLYVGKPLYNIPVPTLRNKRLKIKFTLKFFAPMDPDPHSQYGSGSRRAKSVRIRIHNTVQNITSLHGTFNICTV